MFLKISNYEDTVRQLDIYYGIGIKIFLYYFLLYIIIYYCYNNILYCYIIIVTKNNIIKYKNYIYFLVKRQLLRYQSCITGLFPQVSNDKIVGSVRESIYCAAAIWSLYQAYR